MLGLKTFGIIFSTICILGLGWSTYSLWITNDKPPAITIVAGLITIGLLLAWLLWVTEGTVKLTANRYARFILEAVLELE